MRAGDARQALEVRLDELQARARHIGADLAAPHSPDSEEAATELEAEEALIGQGALIEREIVEVRAALDRLATGTYGACVTCGEEIAPARLAAMPEAAQCIACASGGVSR